jgi:hypothetical protein
MYDNGTMRPVETVLRREKGRTKAKDWESDIL